jgi:hypothetical protein
VRIVSAILGLFVGLTVAAHSASFSVTNLADSGARSLRQAIVDSEASAGADEITFPGVTGTITLQSILPTISGEVTIVGPGSTALKVSGNNLTQLFSIASGALVHISGLTIADGRAEAYLNGGAVNNAGTLTIGDCVLTNNHAHGGFGGAIYNEGELTISNSTFTGNHVTAEPARQRTFWCPWGRWRRIRRRDFTCS